MEITLDIVLANRTEKRCRYRDTCIEVHKHWKVMFWTEEMALDLVSQHFPEFLPIWKFYDMEVSDPPSYHCWLCLLPLQIRIPLILHDKFGAQLLSIMVL